MTTKKHDDDEPKKTEAPKTEAPKPEAKPDLMGQPPDSPPAPLPSNMQPQPPKEEDK